MNKRDKLEPLADGWVGFHTESGDHWKHKDVSETGPSGTAHYRLFVADKGEQRRYTFMRVSARLAEHEHLRVVVYGQRLFGVIVGDFEWPDSRI